nr:MAG TPA: hypothetical protein [Caudoviricetes sp.]
MIKKRVESYSVIIVHRLNQSPRINKIFIFVL